VVSDTPRLKILAPDGKKRLTNMLDCARIIALGKTFPGTMANRFAEWVTVSNESFEGKSNTKAFGLFESSFVLLPEG
jgi:cell filamentation protein